MGNVTGVTPTASELKARALELQKTYEETGVNYIGNQFKDKKTGAIFNFKRNENGEITYSYSYNEVKTKDILLFEKATIATQAGGITTLTEEQLKEYKKNHPNSYVTTQYAAADEAIKLREKYAKDLNSEDKNTRKAAEKGYKKIVSDEFYASGTVDKKAADKMAKWSMKDAKSGEVAAATTTYIDKAEFDAAKKQLDNEKKAAKKRIKEAKKYGFTPNEADLLKLEEKVQYIKDKDIRRYVELNRSTFYDENGNFSSDKYKEWAKSHLQGDNTLTTGERKPASAATTLSEKDMKKAVKNAGFDAQNDPTLAINLAKTAVGALIPVVVAACTNRNITDVSNLYDKLEIKPDPANEGQYLIFLGGESIANATSYVKANFANVAVRNALLGALTQGVIGMMLNPEKHTQKQSDARTASTILTQNIFRGREEINIEGNGVIKGPEQNLPVNNEKENYTAEIIEIKTDGDCKETIFPDAQRLPKAKVINGKTFTHKQHGWNALCSAYGVKFDNSDESKTFRNQYRKDVIGGSHYFSNKNQEIPCEYTYTYNGSQKTVRFDKNTYVSTWDYYRKGGTPKEGNANFTGGNGSVSYSGSASYTINENNGFFTTDGKTFKTERDAKNYLKGKVNRDNSLNTDQKVKLNKKIDETKVEQ